MPPPQIPERNLRYRADIDGIRAIAVVPVVLYHFGVPGFGGGYVGVDVFFVISGFLITSLLRAEIGSGTLTVLGFYERRVRRIFPALFAVILASFVAATVLFFPRDLLRLAESVAATTLFGSNFDFWLQSGYFDAGSDLKPLLHTWSLAVEEQFYLVFPLVLYVTRAWDRAALLALVAVLAVASFGLSVWGVRVYPTAAFYLAPFRAWELMVGAAIALAPAVRLGRWATTALSIAGLGLIGLSVALLTAQSRFPGEAALAPCIGTALLILGGENEQSPVARLLSFAPLVGVGLLSYSLYLWHWPILVFARYLTPAEFSPGLTAGLIALAGLMAFLSWRFVERPFRVGRGHLSRRALFQLAGLVMALNLVAAGAAFALRGLPERFPLSIQRVVAEADDIEPRRHACFDRTPDEVMRGDICTIGPANAIAPTFLLWGDSHADALLPGVEAAARREGKRGLYIAHGRCPPLLGIKLSDEAGNPCPDLNREVLRLLEASPRIDRVILVARWAYYERGTGFGVDGSETRRLLVLPGSKVIGADQHALFADALTRTVRALLSDGKKVLIIGPVPEIGVPVPETMGRALLYGAKIDTSVSVAAFHRREDGVFAAFAPLAHMPGVLIVEPARALCSSASCAMARNGIPLYADHHHLSVYGARAISWLFDDKL